MPTLPAVTRGATAVAARSLVATVETVGFAVVAHTCAGGQAPPTVQIVMLAAVVFAAAWGVLAGRVRIRVVAPFVAFAQIGLHLGFSGLTGTSPGSGSTAPMGAGHDHMAGMGASSPGSAIVHASDARMLITHAAITLVTVLVLVLQERALGVLAALVSGEVLALGPTASRLRTLRSLLRTVRWQAVLLSAATRRGPPRGLLLAS